MQVGIDVGYSKRTPSCGLAVWVPRGTLLPGWPRRPVTWMCESTGGSVQCARLTLPELLCYLPTLRCGMPGPWTVVLDGPLGPDGPPTRQRHVDAECQRGLFRNRATPSSVTGGGKALVGATYEIAEALTQSRTGLAFRFSASRLPCGPDVQVFETMPTIGLAVVQRMVSDTNVLPSRRKPVPGFQAKSDYYWAQGGGARVAVALDAPAASGDADHERRAALYCLAVARQIDDPSSAGVPVCVGDAASGVYVLQAPIHADWSDDLSRVGHVP